MKTAQAFLLLIPMLVLASSPAVAGEGQGSVVLGYSYLDEEGNQSGYYRSYNEYEGVGLSLDNFRYRFDNGVRLTANLHNLTLNNRRLNFGIGRPGRFGLEFSHSQYRRTYSFDGSSSTRRRQTAGEFWVQPHRYIRLFGGATAVTRRGEAVELFQITTTSNFVDATRIRHDYSQTGYHAGFQLTQGGRTLRAEYRTTAYRDDELSTRDQDRVDFRINALLPIPRFEQLIAHGGFKTYETEYDTDKRKITSNTGWGGATYTHASGVSLRYSVIFNRAGSNTDPIKTDNIVNAVYAGYAKARLGGVTLGYQHDVQDDLEDVVEANSYYLSGWLKPTEHWDMRAEYGTRAEEVTEGSRVVGDEDRNRHRLSVTYRHSPYGWLRGKYEQTHRENTQLGTEVDFDRIMLDASATLAQYGTLTAGYAHAVGEYANVTEADAFEFSDDVLYGDVALNEYLGLAPGFGATYYRSKRDLDIENFSLDFTLSYRFLKAHRLEAEYRVHNFDDYLLRDGWYTANIVEIRLINDIAF